MYTKSNQISSRHVAASNALPIPDFRDLFGDIINIEYFALVQEWSYLIQSLRYSVISSSKGIGPEELGLQFGYYFHFCQFKPSFRKTPTFAWAALATITLLAPHSSLNFSTSARLFISCDPPFAIIGIFTLSAIFRIAPEISVDSVVTRIEKILDLDRCIFEESDETSHRTTDQYPLFEIETLLVGIGQSRTRSKKKLNF